MLFLKKVSLLLTLLTVSLMSFSLSGCENRSDSKTIKVGTIAGPETELMEVAKQVAKKNYGLKIKIVQFTDYVLPNEALADGSIDANMFQHQSFLDEAIKMKGYKLVAIGKTFVYPMGLYSKKMTSLDQIPNEAIVVIPNDPSNEARALLLLEKSGLIQLNPNAGIKATIKDISFNPKHLRIKELDAAQLPRVLPDVALAAINTNYAMPADLLPSRDALVIESPDSPYANIVVVRADTLNDPRFQQLMNALHSDQAVKKAQELFKGQAIPAWKTNE